MTKKETLIAYKFRIYPSKSQEETIQKTFGCTRFVYNYYLNKRKEVYQKTKKTFNYYKCSADMTQLKKSLCWLKDVDCTALQSSLRYLDDAFENFFRRVKKGGNPGFPKYKRKHDRHKSYKTNGTIRLFDAHVQLPKLGLVKCRVSKRVDGRILSITVSQNPSGKYFASIIFRDMEPEVLQKTNDFVGIDFGVKELAVSSNGQVFANPKHLIRSQKKLAKLQRQLSRKSKDGRNWEKSRVKVARLHEHIANQRLDNAHKMTTALVRDYDLIAIETLVQKDLLKNRVLSKAISDAAWGEIARQLEYKCAWYGKKLIKVDRFFASSQICSTCGFKNLSAKNMTVRKWDCPKCGEQHNRDINAAKNILSEAQRMISAARN